ncbi:hypothetical protein [Leifsonia aquatica]|uniref:hypothetical protein n=1 Tax=Leifsonia aquatica TaxID=144185 RepID=UPI000AA0A086|nr:hypothetical protein [Leifsonia aquatica]
MSIPVTALVWASCATAPPNGEPCNDTPTTTVLTPWWLPLVIVGIVLVVLAVVVLIRTRSRRA